MSRATGPASPPVRLGLALLEGGFLTVLWIVLWGTWSIANLVGGMLLAATVVFLLPTSQRPSGRSRIRPLSALVFLAYFVVKLVQANLHMAWIIINPLSRVESGVVAVPVRDSSDGLLTVVANFITLTPGTLTLEVRHEPPTLYVHVMQLGDPATVHGSVRHIQALAIRAFGSPEVLAALRAESTQTPGSSSGSSAVPDEVER